MDQCNLLILGSTTLDENIIRGKSFQKIGGVPVYAGFTYKKLGCNPTIISNIADTDLRIPQFFQTQGIVLKSSPAEKTTCFINKYIEDHRIQRMPCAAPPIHSQQLTEAWTGINHIHLGPLHPGDIDPDIYKLDFQNRLVTLDIQGLTRCIENGKVIATASPLLENALSAANIVKADDLELNLALQYLNLSARELMIRFNIDEIVETWGDAGGRVHTRFEIVNYPSQPKTRIVDTTGAGDVFFAAHLFSRIYKKQPIRESCDFAAAIATKHIEGQWLPVDLLNVE